MLPSVLDGHRSVSVNKAGDEVRSERWRRTLYNAGPDQHQDQDHEAKARLRAQQEQRHLETYWSMHRFRDVLRRRYCSLLKEKLRSQRLELQQECVRAAPRPNNCIKQNKHRIGFSKLQHDDSYLKALPKTSYYLIFDLQSQLVQRGHLQSHQELEDFYKCIKYNSHPSQLQRGLLDIKRKMLDQRPAVTLTTRPETPSVCAAEDAGHKGNIFDSRLAEGASESGQCLSKMVVNGSLEKDEFEQMFPKMKVPTFITLQPNFMKIFQSKMPDLVGQTTLQIPKKSRKAEIYLKQLKEMHNVCLTNMCFSQRLLDRKIDSLCWLKGQDIQELTLPDIDLHKSRQSNPSTPTLIQQQTIHDNPPPSAHELNKCDKGTNCSCLESAVWDNAERCSETPDPLCIEDVHQQKHVKVISCGPKVWRNYDRITE